MGALLKFETETYWLECAYCGISFGILNSWKDRLQKRTTPAVSHG